MDVNEEERVDINSASVEEFVTRLKGVGHSKAKAIVRFRTTVGKFKELCELTDVPGITQCILEKNLHVLLCLSSQSGDLQSIEKGSDSGHGDGLCTSSFIFSSESGGEDSIELNGQDQVHWKRNLCDTFSSGNQSDKPENKNIAIKGYQLTALETPCSSSYNLQDSGCSSSSNTPIMRPSRSRSRSKNEERTFGMSTRSTPSSSHDLRSNHSSLDSLGNGTSILPQYVGSSPVAMGAHTSRSRKTLLDKPVTRRRNEQLKSAALNTLDQSSERDSGTEEENRHMKTSEDMDIEHNNANATKQHTKPIMKRKLDEKSDRGKLQSPQKKACKSLRRTTSESTISANGISEHTGKDENLDKSPLCQITQDSPTLHGTVASKTSPIKLEGITDWLGRFQEWNATERLSAIDRLINVCEPRQVRHMLEVIEPQFQRDFISLLPKELALYVLTYLDPKDLLVAAQTCRYWRILAEDNILWREKCAEEGIREPYYPKVCKSSWKTKRTNSVNGDTLQPSAWKAAFIRQHCIETNWRNGNHKTTKLLKGHDDHVITCLQFSGTRIVSGSDDNTLKVWSAISGKCLRTLVGHTGGVWASQMRKNMIISGSTDRTLKIWNADTGACMHTLYGHTSTVRCMALHDNIVVSGSRDATLRVWDVNTGNCLHVLTGHMAAVRCVCYDGKLVVSGAYDYNVKVWDPEKEECLYTFEGHTNRVYSLQFDGVHVVSGSLDTLIKVWSVETGQCIHTLVGHQSLTSGMELKNNILVSGNADSTVKMWDIVSGECLKTLEGPQKHQSAVTCLQFCGKFVITSSDDGTVKLWDVETGKAIRNLVSLESRGSGGVVWRIRASQTKLVCAVGSRNGTEETKLLVLDFDPDAK